MTAAIVIIITGFLSFGPALPKVAKYREREPVKYELEPGRADQYDCLAGLPYGFGHLIGSEVFFLAEDGRTFGPILVVDVAQRAHAGIMESRNLAADIFCPGYSDPGLLVHLPGSIYIIKNQNIR